MWRATQSYFTGEWQMVRIIEDVGQGVIGEVWGEAVFTPDRDGLACTEAGVLRFNGADHLHFRGSLWRFRDDGTIEVRYDDGRPFHEFLTDDPIALSFADGVEYRIEYDFDVDTWLSVWEATEGANKYQMTTRYRRPGTALEPFFDPDDTPQPFDPLKGE